MLKKKITKFLLFFILCSYFSNLKAQVKDDIILKIRETNTLKFNFIQISNGLTESGFCSLKRPHFLKCEYNSKNQKQLIVNKKKLVIFHKRYNKAYNYPLSKSFFTQILDKKAFEKIILNGDLNENNEKYIVNCNLEEKGFIDFYFNKQDLSLVGWDLISINNNKLSFEIKDIIKNEIIENKFFNLPEFN